LHYILPEHRQLFPRHLQRNAYCGSLHSLSVPLISIIMFICTNSLKITNGKSETVNRIKLP
jgi:hypothetical protein